MRAIIGLFGSAVAAAKQGTSANKWIKDLQAVGLGARRKESLALYRIAKKVAATGSIEPFKPPEEIPNVAEIAPYPVKTPRGIFQRVSIVYRDLETGEMNMVHWATVTPEGITREEAIAQAVDSYSAAAVSYKQELVGAIHTGAYNEVPMGY